jgi:hypothetical protein
MKWKRRIISNIVHARAREIERNNAGFSFGLKVIENVFYKSVTMITCI